MSSSSSNVAPEDFHHIFLPAPSGAGGPAGVPTALLLHGTGGDEHDLVGVGRALLPGANQLGVRGRVLENGTVQRWFRRVSEGVFDEADIVFRADELASWLPVAAARHGFDASRVVAIGYSNGANLAAAVLLRRPGTLRAAVLFRPMPPLRKQTAAPPATAGTTAAAGSDVLLLSGRHDPLVPLGDGLRLGEMLRAAGATVDLRWQEADHGLGPDDFTAARRWLADLGSL